MRMLALFALVLSSLCAHAASYTPVVLVSGTLTNNTALSNSIMVAQAAIIDCGMQTNVPIAISYTSSAPNKHTNYLYFVRSVDRVNWDTEGGPLIIELGNADTPSTTVSRCFTTNLPAIDCGYWLLTYTTNHSAATMSFNNYKITWGRKVL